jgi:hypothetical protein
MNIDKGDIACRKAIAASGANFTRFKARVKSYPRKQFGSPELLREPRIKLFDPPLIALKEIKSADEPKESELNLRCNYTSCLKKSI